MSDLEYMYLAYDEALKALENDDVPIGAIIVKDGEVIASAYNKKELLQDVTAHAEILAIREACCKLGSWHLDGCTLYSTLEPCIMCSGAIIQSRIDRVVFGASVNRWNGLDYYINEVEFNHSVEVVRGIYRDECSKIISDYFKSKRIKNKDTF